MKARWRHLANTIKLCFLRATKVHHRNGKSIGLAIFAQLMAVSSGTLAPPGEYDWTYAFFGPPKSITQMAIRSVQPFFHSARQNVPILYNGRPFPKNCPVPMGDLGPHLMHGSFGQSKPTTQTASRSVQLFLHWWLQSVPILYNGLPLSPSSKLLLPMGDLCRI